MPGVATPVAEQHAALATRKAAALAGEVKGWFCQLQIDGVVLDWQVAGCARADMNWNGAAAMTLQQEHTAFTGLKHAQDFRVRSRLEVLVDVPLGLDGTLEPCVDEAAKGHAVAHGCEGATPGARVVELVALLSHPKVLGRCRHIALDCLSPLQQGCRCQDRVVKAEGRVELGGD
jgi:hypothetical protein